MKEADNSIPLVPGLSPGAGAASRNSTLTSGFVTENHEIRVEQRENHQEDHHEDEEFPVDEDGEDLFKVVFIINLV